MLSGKQMLVLANIADRTDVNELADLRGLEERCQAWNLSCAIINAKLEHNLHEFPESEWDEFFQAYGLEGPAKRQVIQESYRILRRQSFLTCGPDEVRAWTIPIGIAAQQAAGKIHSDIERGFIRAETIAFDDLKDYGSEDQVKKAGRYRLEGKDYVVQDGDVITFRFSV